MNSVAVMVTVIVERNSRIKEVEVTQHGVSEVTLHTSFAVASKSLM